MVLLIITNMSLSDISNRDDISNFIEYKTSELVEEYVALPEYFTSTTNWVFSTNLKCWNHHEQFDGTPVFIPIKWNYQNDQMKIKTFGCFCGWNCAKTFVVTANCNEISEYNKSKIIEDLFRLAKIFDKDIQDIHPLEPFYKQVEYSGSKF